MATSQPVLAVGRGLYAVRATLLSSTGTRTNCGVADTSAYSLCVQSLTPSTNTDAGETQTINCGTGTTRATFTTADSVTDIDITLEFVEDDIEFIQLITGGVLTTDGASNTTGLSQRAGSVTAPVFELHAWEIMYDNAGIAASLPYTHHCWGYVTNAQVGDKVLQEGFTTRPVTMTAQGVTGANLGNGSFLDIPAEAFEGDSNGAFYAYWRAASSDVPDADTSPYNNGLGGGYITTPACSS